MHPMGRLGPFELGAEIARERERTRVHRAIDSRDGSEAVVKIVSLGRADDMQTAELKLRFRREAEAGRKVSHPSIRPLKDAGIEDERLWLATAAGPGAPLTEFTSAGHRLEPKRVASLLLRLADALDAAQAAGLARCDLEPDSVLLAGDSPLLLDFALSRVGDPRRPGSHLGSRHFLSPEQARGGAPGAVSNQFALAVLAFHLLTGAWPFPGRESDAIEELVLAEPEPIGKLRPELPGALNRALSRALNPEPANRFARLKDFAQAFAAGFDEETILPPREPSMESGIWPSGPPAAERTLKTIAAGAKRRLQKAVPKSISFALPKPTGMQAAIAAGALLVVAAVALGASQMAWSREERITRMAERGDVARAQAALKDWRASDPDSASLAVTEGHVACARKDYPACCAAYVRALALDPTRIQDKRLVPNAMSAVGSAGARGSLVDLAPKLPAEVESTLRNELTSSRWAVRWNAARMLEARGHGAEIDWNALYLADLTGDVTCGERKHALQHLDGVHEVRVLTAIQQEENDPRAKACRMQKALKKAESAFLGP